MLSESEYPKASSFQEQVFDFLIECASANCLLGVALLRIIISLTTPVRREPHVVIAGRASRNKKMQKTYDNVSFLSADGATARSE
jgi:hypothetical protein